MSRRSSWYPKRLTYPQMIFFVEGTVTERQYIEDTKRAILQEIPEQQRRVISHYIQVSDKTVQDPKGLVNLAIKSNLQKNDVGVIVIDEDNRNTTQEIISRNNAIKNAKEKGFVFIYSIPCFEFWVLLHFQETSACLTGNECQKRLHRLMPSYNHQRGNLQLDFKSLYPHYNEATERAQRLISQHTDKCLDIDLENPTSNAFLIKSEIEKFVESFLNEFYQDK